MAKSKPFRRAVSVISLTVSALILLAAAGTIFTYPAVAALGCPTCYGFTALGGNVLAERSMTSEQRAHAETVIAQSREQVQHFYGDLRSNPRIFVCATQDCYRHIGGGGSRGMAVLGSALFLSPRGIDPVIAAHELSHIELHRRLGLVGALRQDIPQWFDEGVAVVVSGDSRYLAKTGSGDRCLIAPDEELPVARAEWIRSAAHNQLYAKAACRVSRWVDANGGFGAVTRLIEKVAGGVGFDAAYGDPR